MEMQPYRYEKFSEIIYDGTKSTLIEHLQNLRVEKKISKAHISKVIKNNDYWYSQIEMKKEDNRRKYIKRSELIDIISVLCYNAKNKEDLIISKTFSENYIDNTICAKAIDVDNYNRIYNFYVRNSQTQDNIIDKLLESISSQLKTHYDFMKQANYSTEDINIYIKLLKNFNESLKADKYFTISYIGLPLYEFLNTSIRNDKEQLIFSLTEIIDNFNSKLNLQNNDLEGCFNSITKLLSSYGIKIEKNI